MVLVKYNVSADYSSVERCAFCIVEGNLQIQLVIAIVLWHTKWSNGVQKVEFHTIYMLSKASDFMLLYLFLSRLLAFVEIQILAPATIDLCTFSY